MGLYTALGHRNHAKLPRDILYGSVRYGGVHRPRVVVKTAKRYDRPAFGRKADLRAALISAIQASLANRGVTGWGHVPRARTTRATAPRVRTTRAPLKVKTPLPKKIVAQEKKLTTLKNRLRNRILSESGNAYSRLGVRSHHGTKQVEAAAKKIMKTFKGNETVLAQVEMDLDEVKRQIRKRGAAKQMRLRSDPDSDSD